MTRYPWLGEKAAGGGAWTNCLADVQVEVFAHLVSVGALVPQPSVDSLEEAVEGNA